MLNDEMSLLQCLLLMLPWTIGPVDYNQYV